MQEQNIVKSIIYGSPIQTSYGMFRSLCSAINHRDHIDKIIFYLRSNENFKKYNKFIYAFRLEQPTNQTFITEERLPATQKFIEGYNDDTGLQGNGEKLLNLLKKFNVRNVLVIVTIRQKDPLKDFNSEHYVQVVKCAKDLLSSLYDKVVMSKDSNTNIPAEQVQYEVLPTKQFNIPIATFYPRQKMMENPNYVGKNFIKKRVSGKNQKLRAQMDYLSEKIQELANKLEDVIEDFMEIEDSQIEFAVRYDQSQTASKVFSLLAQLFGINSRDKILMEIRNYPGPSRMSNYLRSITTKSITSECIRKLNQQIMSNQKLKASLVSKQNQICGLVMSFIQILLKSYSFARRLALIESEVEEQYQVQEGGTSEKQQSKRSQFLSQ